MGFRPFVYTLAQQNSIAGSVQNDPQGVTIIIEGAEHDCEQFMSGLQTGLPPLARIDSMQTQEEEPLGLTSFEILESDQHELKTAVVSPDMAICENCLKEMRNISDRRHGYWLINCTDCGPRYSIIETVPYDRPNTSMRFFTMCDACAAEYHQPADRRYHAQPISCYDCGPRLAFRHDHDEIEGETGLQRAIASLKSGEIIAVKGLGGFHLMCDATNETTVQRLRMRKRRPFKPFAVMFPTVEMIEQAAQVSETEYSWIRSKEKPIVLVRKRSQLLAPSVAPFIDRLGLFLPYTPLHYRLFESIDFPLVATSANLSDEPIIRTEKELIEKLGDIIDGMLTHERDIVNSCDDSVIQVVDSRPLVLRLARGFAPLTVTLPFHTSKSILAVGANQKNTIAIAFENRIVMSPHIGDLGTITAFEYFERTLETFKRFYDFEPDVIVCDKHPGYETTKWASSQQKPIIQVQHHYAHLLAALAEMQRSEPVVGFTFDGTGYGDDGTIWGGEVLHGDSTGFKRLGHLLSFRLLGGEKAVREPWRIGLGVLFECYTLDEVLALDLTLLHEAGADQIRLLHQAWERGINAPQTTSVGRLFDAVASLADIVQRVSYEGESGLRLESLVTPTASAYPVTIEEGIIDWRPMIITMVESSESSETIVSRFIATMVAIMVQIAKEQSHKVVLTGGVFQNRTLLEQLMERFEEEGIDYFIPSRFPVNDGCIALGQLWHALHVVAKP